MTKAELRAFIESICAENTAVITVVAKGARTLTPAGKPKPPRKNSNEAKIA